MANDLYFIPILAQALEQTDPRAALQAAFAEIERLSRNPQYAQGWVQFQRFMTAARQGRERDSALEQLVIDELIVELAAGLFDGSDQERQAALDLVQSKTQWRTAYGQACRELAGPGGTERDLIVHFRQDEQTIGRLVLGPTSRTASSEHITPGRYALALDTGRVIGEGTLTAQDSMWAQAFPGEPFDLAAADGRVLAHPAWRPGGLNWSPRLLEHAEPMIGRVKGVLRVPAGAEQPAVSTWILAHALDERQSERVRFTGPGTFDQRVQAHVRDVIVPVVDRILTAVQQPRRSHALSVANVGAAGAVDLGIRVSGFSADVPVLLAILSASLGIPIAEDLVATGHVASVDGDIAIVHGLPPKLSAALADASIRRFVHPALDDDTSRAALTPGQWQGAAEALQDAGDRVRTIAVGDVAELLAAVFTDKDIVLSSLTHGFFGADAPPVLEHGPADKAAHYVLAGNVGRFWSVLERHLLHGEGSAARRRRHRAG